MADFHFLRPLWLFLILTLPLLYLAQHRLRQGNTGWARYIPPALLQPLIRRRGEQAGQKPSSPLLAVSLAAVILALALAGPSWRQAPTPLKQPEDSLVIALDLSLSMLATDVEPDRLTLAKRKVRDILAERQGGLTALLVYSGDAHVVTPLTEDHRTIEAMLRVLEPTIMPAQGNRTDLAIEQAVRLLENGAPGRGRILLIADDVPAKYQIPVSNRLNATPYTLSTLTVGTEEGGPIPLARRGFIRDGNNIVITRADPTGLADLARGAGGKSHELTLNNTDIQALELEPDVTGEWAETRDGLTINRWQDDGYWLLWLALPLLLLGWRRGAFAILALSLLPLTVGSRPALALDWGSLWQREDQRGPELIEQNPAQAAELLEQPGWRGSALYRSERYDDAIKAFSDLPGANGHYNRGNALAKAGKLQPALEAYQKALAENPNHEDARFNQELVQQMLNQQQQQQNPGQEGDQNQEQNSDQQNRSDSQNSQSQQSNDGQPSDNRESQDSNPQNQQQPQDTQNAERQDDPGQASSEPQAPEPPEGEQPASGQPSDPQAEAQPRAEAPVPVTEQPLSQGQEQWLRRVPDNPGGLLQRKFLQQYQQRQTQPDEGDTPW